MHAKIKEDKKKHKLKVGRCLSSALMQGSTQVIVIPAIMLSVRWYAFSVLNRLSVLVSCIASIASSPCPHWTIHGLDQTFNLAGGMACILASATDGQKRLIAGRRTWSPSPLINMDGGSDTHAGTHACTYTHSMQEVYARTHADTQTHTHAHELSLSLTHKVQQDNVVTYTGGRNCFGPVDY